LGAREKEKGRHRDLGVQKKVHNGAIVKLEKFRLVGGKRTARGSFLLKNEVEKTFQSGKR